MGRFQTSDTMIYADSVNYMCICKNSKDFLEIFKSQNIYKINLIKPYDFFNTTAPFLETKIKTKLLDITGIYLLLE